MSRRYLCMLAALMALTACEKAQEVSVLPEPAQAEEDNEPWVLKNMIDLFQPGPGGPVTLSADYGGTRAHIDMNDEETFAQWVWKAGDSFEMFAFAGSSYQYATFTATESGAVADFTAQYSIDLDPPFYAIYPGPGKLNLYNGKPLFGVNIPVSQEAVLGGIKDGYTFALATA